MSVKPRVTVIVAEPQTLLRRAYERILRDAPEIELLGAYATPEDLRNALGKSDAQMAIVSSVLVFDADGEETNDLLKFLKRTYPAVNVVVLGGPAAQPEVEDKVIFQAVRSGVTAYVPSDREPEQLVAILRAVSSGAYSIDEFFLQRPELVRRLVSFFRNVSEQSASSGYGDLVTPLSPRELQILELIAQKGYSNKEVAGELRISDQTVKNHMSSIMRKLAVNDRTQAVVMALRHRWISDEAGRSRAPHE